MPGISEYPPHKVERPLMFQNWTQLTFVHWRYDPDQLRPLLPPGLLLDTYDGAAWVGLVPFIVESLRPPFVPPLPWISHFPETNIRTYVLGPDGERGIWFFTLEADRLAAVIGARLSYGLPYRWASMRVDPAGNTVAYSSHRHPFATGQCRMKIGIGTAVIANELERFITARFTLYSVLRRRLMLARVEHEPWPLKSAEILDLVQNIDIHSGIPAAQGTPLVHFSPGVHVRVGRPQRAGKR